MTNIALHRLDTIGAFAHERVSEHVVRVHDCMGIAVYLVTGTDRALLIDTACGLGNLRACIETITDLPLTVVASHGHFDHIGGSGTFDEVLMAREELPIAREEAGRERRSRFYNEVEGMETTPADFQPVPLDNVGFAEDGQVFELGGANVELVQAPGHTPGIFAFHIEPDGALVLGDICDDNVMLFNGRSSTVSGYLAGLRKLRPYLEKSGRLWGNHGDYSYERGLVAEVERSCERILAHEDAHFPVTMFGHEMFSANPLDGDMGRSDGLVGNVLYTADKAR